LLISARNAAARVQPICLNWLSTSGCLALPFGTRFSSAPFHQLAIIALKIVIFLRSAAVMAGHVPSQHYLLRKITSCPKKLNLKAEIFFS
jgi:hypothetical protein